MQGEPGTSSRQRNQGMVPLLAEENSTLPPISLFRSMPASSSSPSSPSSSGSSISSLASTSSPSSSSSSSLSSNAFPPLSQRRSTTSDQRRRSKPTREWYPQRLPKPFSEPSIPSLKESLAMEAAADGSSMASQPAYRRCMTDTDFKTIHGMPPQAAPDLLQLFNIFQFNTPEKPPARMLVNVTLVGTIQPVRLLVAYDASVQDVIKASLKGYAKEGRLPRHCSKSQPYGLHYSPFCLESIDPTEMISSLGTRSFFLFPRVDQLPNPTQNSKEGKPWWNILSLLLT